MVPWSSSKITRTTSRFSAHRASLSLVIRRPMYARDRPHLERTWNRRARHV